jgi:hypothetical protein
LQPIESMAETDVTASSRTTTSEVCAVRLRARRHADQVAAIRCLAMAIAACLIALTAPICRSASAQEAEEVNTGQDVTKPVRRVDFRVGYTDPGNDLNVTTFVLRTDQPVDLGGGQKIGLRLDAPFILNDVPSSDNPDGDLTFGYGDTLLQALYIKALNPSLAVGAGTQLIIPTGTKDQFTAGKWRLVPTVGVRTSLPQISPGSFFLAAVRYDFDVAGDDDRAGISELQFSTTLNIALPNAAFLTLFPSTDIRYDLKQDELFIPFNVQIGKVFDRRIATSLEVGVPIYSGYDVYDFKAEARIGLFF